jgi:hypothetical protein
MTLDTGTAWPPRLMRTSIHLSCASTRIDHKGALLHHVNADAFTPGGVLLSHLDLHGPLHSPWGIALAPADFGPMRNALLITNNISRGRINAFDPNSGAFLGPLRDATGKPIEIDDIWAIQFGQSGVAGSNGNTNQLFTTLCWPGLKERAQRDCSLWAFVLCLTADMPARSCRSFIILGPHAAHRQNGHVV